MNDSVDKQLPLDRRSRTKKEIKQLITERNEVLALYVNLAGRENSISDSADIAPESIQEFCQLLIDYIATGHFELYRRISEGEERRKDILKLASNIFPRIEITTQIAVEFNDLFDGGNNYDENLKQKLPNYLSKLGEELATRIELEDQLINTLLASKEAQTQTVQ